MQQLPIHVSIVFIATTFLTLHFFYKAANSSKKLLIITLLWLLVYGLLAACYFFTKTNTTPPRLSIVLLPNIIAIILAFTTTKGKAFIDGLSAKYLTILSIIRIPVEIVLLWLFIYKAVPKSMTFEGQNFDIISGITSPVIYYFLFIKKKQLKTLFIVWNILCLTLVLNVVINGILSVPSPFQKLSFNQPNVAVLYFPFIWLVSFIVPVVIFSHLVLLKKAFAKTL